MQMSIESLVAQLRRTAGKFGEALEQGYNDAVMPYWLAQARRKRDALCGAYVVVTGSCGKSTTAMMLSTLLGAQGKAASGLLNNTARWVMRPLRKLRDRVDFFVQEASEYPRGSLASVARLAPDVAIVTSVGLDHLEEFRTREVVAEEISALTAAVGEKGTVCLNADDDLARQLARGAQARVLLFGRAADADVKAENVHSQLPERLSFDLVIVTQSCPERTRFAGTLMLTNILGALAAVHALGLDLERAIADLAKIEPIRNRMSIIEVPGGHTFLLDAHKAPIWSTRLLVDDLPNIWAGRRVFVLGEMSDIGRDSGRRYRGMLRSAAAHSALVVGARQARNSATRLAAHDPSLPVRSVADLTELEALLRNEPPSLVVFKGNKVRIDAMIENLVAARAGAAG